MNAPIRNPRELTPENERSPSRLDNPAEQIERLLERMRDLPKRRRARAWQFAATLIVVFSVAFVALVSTGEEALPAVTATLFVTCCTVAWIWWRAEQRERQTLTQVAACNDIRSAVLLLEHANYGNRAVRETVHCALLQVLPRLNEADSDMLSRSHNETLNALLYGKSTALATAALYALEHVGTGSAIPYLKSIAAGKGVPHCLRDGNGHSREQARRSLAAIQMRLESQTRERILLRASTSPGTPQALLVRPAGAGTTYSENNLVRPAAQTEVHRNTKED